MEETNNKMDLRLLKNEDLCIFKNGKTARVLNTNLVEVYSTPVIQITFDHPVRIKTTKSFNSDIGVLVNHTAKEYTTLAYFTDGQIGIVGEEVAEDYYIIDCLRNDGTGYQSIFTGKKVAQDKPTKDEERLPIVVSKIKPGQWCGFDNHEQAIVKTISPSRLHKRCFDIKFDRLVTGYIDGRRGGERRNEWCYDADGKFANYKGKANNILFVWGITTVTLDGKPVDKSVDTTNQTTVVIPDLKVQKVTDEQGNIKSYCAPNVDPTAILKPFDKETYPNISNVSENDLFERLEYLYKTGKETPANILDKAVRLFALAAGITKGDKSTEELSSLCDADNDYDFWFPVKYKDEPWKPMRSMSGICTPYRFKSQESCMKAISKIGRDGLNKIFGVK